MGSNHKHPKQSSWGDGDLEEPTFLCRQHLAPIVTMVSTSTDLREDPVLGVPRAVSLHVWREEGNRLRRKRGQQAREVHWAYIQLLDF